MNYQMIGYVIGRILLTEAALLVLPAVTALAYGESLRPFLLTALLLVAVGLIMGRKKPIRTALYARDGFAVVALAWLLMSAFGALPFVISGDIPFYVDAFFETVSGFTTTGASILTEIEPLHRGILFWRSFTHWVGGMGVLVFVMAILPMTDGHGMHLMRAEVPGPSVGKLVSRMSDTAKILYGIYLVLTVIEIVLLMAGGMPLFDSCIHAFGSAGTGGFSNRNLSVGAYDNAYFDVVIGVFMLLFGVNFNLYYFLLIKRFKDVFHSEELRAYLGIVAAAVIAIAVDILHIYGSVGKSLRYAFFQVSSIITTTGFATADFNSWPTFSKGILVVLMFVGACAGSTGGGVKVARVVILVKSSLADMRKMLHPNAIATVRFEGKPLTERSVRGVHVFISVYVLVFAVSFLLLTLEGFDLITTFTALAACINNIGPGLEVVGPMGNYAQFSPWAKLLLSFNMLVGRLEIFPMLLLCAPSIWKRRIVRQPSR
ncbi:TrkH family potassium uptake protein [Oscillibacter valericigenes]|uniref:TrkH family potassium uptake protein n=1 Tax=Oscillibacter valericigenes TaxID=351091 RepID=UPI001F25BC9B|nr:TrkH family potassium uptake protein [Oscillibacter valericigenes]MCF2663932.1 TrkH family potassium uptake protein [Oscillibacter valericigenes]